LDAEIWLAIASTLSTSDIYLYRKETIHGAIQILNYYGAKLVYKLLIIQLSPIADV